LKGALSLRSELLGPNHPALVRELHQLAWCSKDMHELETAERLFFKCLTLMGALDTTLQLITSLGEHVDIPDSDADPMDTQASLSSSTTAAIRRTDGHMSNEPLLSEVLVELARVYLHYGRVRLAFALQRQALFVARKALGDRHSRVGTILNNLAISYILREQYGNALLVSRHTYAFLTYPSLLSMNRYVEARQAVMNAIRIRKDALGEEHRMTAHSLHTLAQLYHIQGLYDSARGHYFKVRGAGWDARSSRSRPNSHIGDTAQGAVCNSAMGLFDYRASQ